MASIVLVAAGSSFGWGPLALTVAGIAGSYIDQALIMPALFPTEQQKLSPGRLEDLKIQSASEGTPINRCYGDLTPCYGTVIWMSDLVETANYTAVPNDGKGGGGHHNEISSYNYFVNIAVGVCKGPAQIQKIWANGKLIYAVQENVSVSNITGDIVHRNLAHPPHIQISYVSDDFPNFEVGKNAILSGSGFDAANRGTFKYIGGYHVDGVVYLKFADYYGVSQSLSSPNSITQVPEIYKNLYNEIASYTGIDNTPDSLIESYKGAGNVPAYNGLCYCVIKYLQLDKYGNTIPNLKFLVKKIAAADYPALQVADNTFVVSHDDPGLTHTISISTISELQLIGNDPSYPLDGNYYLTGDIDASDTAGWNGGLGFEPIGFNDYSPSAFTGTLDGCGYKITNLFMDRPEDGSGSGYYIGLFSYIREGGKIANLTLENVDITGGFYVGSLAGWVFCLSGECLIYNCHASGTIKGENEGMDTCYYFGGLVGYLLSYDDCYLYDSTSSVVIDTYTKSPAKTFSRIGGLIGRSVESVIENCRSSGNINCDNGENFIGGFVGISDKYSHFTDCKASGNVRGKTGVGGFLGFKE